MECRDFQEHMESYFYQDNSYFIDPDFEDHLDDCSTCREWVDFHRELLEIGEHAPLPTNQRFSSMRESVLRKLPQPSLHTQPVKGNQFWVDFLRFLQLYPRFAMGCSLVILGMAVWAGRLSVSNQDPQATIESFLPIQSQGYPSLWENPVSYTDVLARPLNGGKVDLSFNVSRRVRLETEANSDLTRNVLVQAILDPSRVGTRIKAMSLAPRIGDLRLRDALIFAVHTDSELAIRLEAIENMILFPFDPKLEAALLNVLEADPSYQMRQLALETLLSNQVNRDKLRQVIEKQNQPGDSALLGQTFSTTL